MATWQENVSKWGKSIVDALRARNASESAFESAIDAVAAEVAAEYGPRFKEVIGLLSASGDPGVSGEHVGSDLMHRIAAKVFRRDGGGEDGGEIAEAVAPAAATSPASPDAPVEQADAPAPDAGEPIGMAGAPAQPGGAGFHV